MYWPAYDEWAKLHELPLRDFFQQWKYNWSGLS